MIILTQVNSIRQMREILTFYPHFVELGPRTIKAKESPTWSNPTNKLYLIKCLVSVCGYFLCVDLI